MKNLPKKSFRILSGIILTAAISLLFTGNPLMAQSLRNGFVYYLPIIRNNQEIIASTSYYLPTTDPVFLYTLGCDQGKRDLLEPGIQDSVVVLDFSYPVYIDAIGYGAALFEDSRYYPTDPAPISAITEGVKGFAEGYYQCSGADTESNLVIGIGTNNKDFSINTLEQTAAHGAAWGEMVNEFNQWALARGMLHQVQAYGASDMELDWNTPLMTRAWISGFESAGDNFLIHFGDASGCPYEDNPYWNCNNNWDLEDVWYVSWGAPPALPLPLIYLNDGVHAQQWAFISKYSLENHGFRLNFTGVFTQSYFCEQFNWSSCERTDNTPEEAYAQLTAELNKIPGTAQHIRWKTDIRWIHEAEVTQSNVPGAEVRSASHPINDEIITLENALQTSTLSPDLRTSLETKLRIYKALASMIETSMQNPAPKINQ